MHAHEHHEQLQGKPVVKKAKPSKLNEDPTYNSDEDLEEHGSESDHDEERRHIDHEGHYSPYETPYYLTEEYRTLNYEIAQHEKRVADAKF